MPRGRCRLTLGLILLIAIALVAIVAGGPAALLLSPALVAAIPLLLGCYPGEELLARLGRRAPRPRGARAARTPRAPRSLGRRPAPLAISGASRAPPALALT